MGRRTDEMTSYCLRPGLWRVAHWWVMQIRRGQWMVTEKRVYNPETYRGYSRTVRTLPEAREVVREELGL